MFSTSIRKTSTYARKAIPGTQETPPLSSPVGSSCFPQKLDEVVSNHLITHPNLDARIDPGHALRISGTIHRYQPGRNSKGLGYAAKGPRMPCMHYPHYRKVRFIAPTPTTSSPDVWGGQNRTFVTAHPVVPQYSSRALSYHTYLNFGVRIAPRHVPSTSTWYYIRCLYTHA